ncbi:MAG: hypothetical protein C5B51_00795 [Terriglobia bacterium]|nr:MAG: hypothetical protein C5B51_00795 [Terriglobia bacterium]
MARRVDRMGCRTHLQDRGEQMRRDRSLKYWRYGHHRRTTGAWGGGIILFLGVILLLDRLGILYARDIFQFWPMLLVAAGLAWLTRLDSLAGRVVGGLTLSAGLLLQANNLGYLRLRGEVFWPFVLIGIGILMLVKALEDRAHPPGQTAEGEGTGWDRWESRARDFLGHLGSRSEATAVFSHVERKITAQDFESCKVEAVFAGVELDLRQAGMKGDEAFVEANAVFGGIEIRVPEDWQVIPRGAGVFGGFNDETRPPEPAPGAPAKRLIVKGAAVFGGVMITNGSRRWHRYR